ncbi:MAG: cell division protein FtsW [Clostridia bacterium]|nr:cell division protein FtsW [Clostridia bacterium]
MVFFALTMLILVIGLVCLLSASHAYSFYKNDGDSYHYIKRQLIFALMGIAAMVAVSFVDYHILHRFAIPLMVVSWGMLVVVRMMPPIANVHRWIVLGPVRFQPSEVAKFALVLLFAHLISINHKRMKSFTRGYLPFVAVLGFTCALVVIEPHLSGTILLLGIGLVMMFVGGTRVLYLALSVLLGGGLASYVIFVMGYEIERVEVWLDPFAVYTSSAAGKDLAWQTVQSLYAIGSGGLLGQGLGNSRQKHLFLPEPQNDFIFSIVCEEMGFIGALLIILLFILLIWRGFSIGIKAPDKFGSMLAIGLTAQVGLQVLFNLAVITNALPNTGISLPFFSYGGTSLLMLLAQIGVILSISRQTHRRV